MPVRMWVWAESAVVYVCVSVYKAVLGCRRFQLHWWPWSEAPPPPSDSCSEYVCICPSVSIFPVLTWWTLENWNFIVLCNHNSASVWIYARGSPSGQSVTRGECVLRNLPDRHPGNCVEGRPRNAGIPGGFIFVGNGNESRGGEGRERLHVFWEGVAVRNK